jgi:SAM-dependent methyltransferase
VTTGKRPTSVEFPDHFSGHARAYAASRPAYPPALYAYVASQARARQRAWDCATGNGQAAIGLAAHFAALEATDASAEQLAHAIPDERVRYSAQPAERTDFADASFDAVCVAQALHWLDGDAFHREAHRVLKPGGVFAAWGYDRLTVSPAFDVTYERIVLPPLKSHWPPENARLWNGYAKMPFPYEPIEAPPFRIEVRWTLRELLAYIGTWSGTKRYMAAGHEDFLAACEAELRPAWGETDRQLVTMPLHFRCGRRA